MTKHQAYAEAQQHGRDAGFVANVIMTQHPEPARKLRGLVKLLRAGSEVRTAQFSLDTLIINGRAAAWTDLENA